jgi:hypothetical protein
MTPLHPCGPRYTVPRPSHDTSSPPEIGYGDHLQVPGTPVNPSHQGARPELITQITKEPIPSSSPSHKGAPATPTKRTVTHCGEISGVRASGRCSPCLRYDTALRLPLPSTTPVIASIPNRFYALYRIRIPHLNEFTPPLSEPVN